MYDNEKAELKDSIKFFYKATKERLNDRVIRGHSRSISTDIENCITLFLYKLLPEGFRYYLDPTVKANGHTSRPDLLIIDDSNSVFAFVEIKSNMGYCRDAQPVIDKMIENDENYRAESNLKCEFSSEEESYTVTYTNKVKKMLISLTKDNCKDEKHDNNKSYAQSKGVSYYNLFTKWYDELEDYEIDSLIEEIQKSRV